MARSFRGYEIEKKIGAGGMATLYLGVQKALNRQVAIKMLHPGLADDDGFIARFEREAKTASSIGHRNIVSVFDFGVEDDVYYIVMELVRGGDLKQKLDKFGAFPPEVVLALLEEICYGLEAAHRQNVVHRDIKPSNVMFTEDGEIKIADFGLAREASDMQRISALTLPGSVLGTPAYMSPEQATGKEIDPRTDIYSLGVMAWELLTGEKPFQGASYSEIRDQIINSDPPPLASKAPVTPEIQALVNRMLEKDPDRRFPSMRHVTRAIEDCMETLDPSGGLIKYRRKYLSKFALDTEAFSKELRHSAISAHLDRGNYFKQMGLAKIDDAVREFRYVLAMDPDNDKANTAIIELQKEAEQSGVRMPPEVNVPAPVERDTRELVGNKKLEPKPPDLMDAPPATAAPADLGVPEGTRVLGGTDKAAPGATRIIGPAGKPAPAKKGKKGKAAKKGKKAGGMPGWLIPAALGVITLIAVLVLQPWSGGGGGGAGGVLALSSEPGGAQVFLRAPGSEEFTRYESLTSCRVEDVEDGAWEVRFELEGFKPQLRRVPVAGKEALLHVKMVPLVTAGRLSIQTTPPGAKFRLKRPGDPLFRDVDGVTPLTTEANSGTWLAQAELAGTGVLTKTVEVHGDSLLTLAWDLTQEFDTGRIEVVSEPSGAEIRVRPVGAKDFERTRLSTPATVPDLAVGRWEVRLDKSGYDRIVLEAEVTRDGLSRVDSNLQKATAVETPAAKKPLLDGYARILIVPFADVYLDGRVFATEQRVAVVPLSAGKTHTVELRHRSFGSKMYSDLRTAPGDTLDLGKHEFRWGEVRVFCSGGIPADLLIDGQQVQRQTPYSNKLGAGKHRFLVRKASFEVVDVIVTGPNGAESHPVRRGEGEVEVDVPADGEVRIQFVLKKDGS
ncbi:MAG: hypothetical protein DHS20C21_12580 [Gemmatimonadota bacterium]|nr:MAG: hypothetical protein DHS20C21_12580 [Gemmatimonadota bacterium]